MTNAPSPEKFIGRQRELDQFSDSLNRFNRIGRLRERLPGQRRKPARVFLPHGIGGIGKTWLSQQCLKLARAKGWKTIELDWARVNLRPTAPLDLMNVIAEDLRDQYKDKIVSDYLKARGRALQARRKVDRVRAENQQKWQELVGSTRDLAEEWVGGVKGKATGFLLGAGGAVVGAGASSLAHAEEIFLDWAVERGELERDDVLLYREGDDRLADRLAKALIKAAHKKSLVVLFDSCEELSVELEEWLRDAIVCPAVREQAPLLFIVAGRADQFSERLQQDATGKRRSVRGYADLLSEPPPLAWDVTRFPEPEVRDYLQARGLPADDELVELAQTVARGIPFALWVFVDAVQHRGRETTQRLFPSGELAGLQHKELVTQVTRRFLRNCLDQKADLQRIYALALLRQPEHEAVAALWDDLPDEASARDELKRLEGRYAFVGIDGRLHDVVGQFARDELRHSERATATRLGQLAAAHYQSRWQACCDDAPHLGERLDDPRWLTLTLQYLNGLLWHNTGSTRTFLAARFVEAMLFDWGFVHALLNLAEAFTRPADWWPRQSQILFRTLHQLLQAEGLDELEPLDELLNRADELDLDPTHQACIHHRRGQVLYEADQALKALDACQRADALLSDDPTLYASVAQLYTRIGWELCLVRNAVVPSVEAEQAFQRAIALRPGAGQAYVGHGVALHGLKRHTKAIQVLQKGIELQGERAYSLNGLGAIYYAQKRYDQAVAAYRRAIELDPNDAAPYNNLGAVYRSQKRYDQAIAAYRRAIELDPNDADLYCNRGVAYSVMGDLAQAEADYLRALELAPDEGWVYASLAGVYRRRDDEEQHAVYLAQARRRLPPDDDYAQACLASIAGDADAAISYLARALEQDLEQRDGAREDPDLHWIRDDPRYQALVAGDE